MKPLILNPLWKKRRVTIAEAIVLVISHGPQRTRLIQYTKVTQTGGDHNER